MLLCDRIKWWEPYRATRQAATQELRAGGPLGMRTWGRPVAIAGVFMTVLCVWIHWRFPAVVIPWAMLGIGLVVVGPGIYLVCAAEMILSPRHIEIRREWMCIAKGQGGYRIERNRISAIDVERDESSTLRLAVEYRTRRGRMIKRSFAVRESIDVDALVALVAHLRPPE